MHATLTHLLAGTFLLLASSAMFAGERKFPADQLFEMSQGNDVQRSDDGQAIELEWGALYEDDGPSAGYSYQPQSEKLGKNVAVKKVLLIDRPEAKSATLMVGSNATLQCSINDVPVELPPMKTMNFHWRTYEVPARLFKSGSNEIVLRGEKGAIWIARDDERAAGTTGLNASPPNRSLKSTDGGRNWDDQHLGAKGDVDGEYCIRVRLEQFRPEGTLVLPVCDVGELDDASAEGAAGLLTPPLVSPGPIRIKVDAQVESTGQVKVRARTGSELSTLAQGWSDWQDLSFPEGTIEAPSGRYVQVALDLSTTDLLHSPRIQSLTIDAKPVFSDDWRERVKVVAMNAEKPSRSSLAFVQETFDHAHLKQLRKQYELDNVVAGAKDELELITRLAVWSSKAWEKGHLGKYYPKWDALDILREFDDGTCVGGFCQHHNLVLVQACQSFGLPARAVSIGSGDRHKAPFKMIGHEVCEIWSNQFKKWIYMDGDFAWYAVDAATGVPLSLWELRERQVKALAGESYPPIRIVRLLDHDRMNWQGLAGEDDVPFLQLRLIPRSNFLSETRPLPLNQGMRGWFWTGHQVWSDPAAPAELLYGNRVTRRGDFEWPLNQVYFNLELLPTPGEIRVSLDTETPRLKEILAKIDDAEPREAQTGFVWKLKPGKNRLELWPRNIVDRDGIKSFAELEYAP